MNKIFIDGIVFSLQRAGGISVYFHELLKYLSLNGEGVSLLLESRCMQKIENFGAPVNLIHHKTRLLERYRNCHISYIPKVFHSSYYRLPDLRCVPTVVTVHDFIYERYQHGPRRWVHSMQKNAAIRAAKSIICVSESTKEDLLNFVGVKSEQSVYVIHNGVSETFCHLNLPPPDIPYVLFVGLRGGYKNFKFALQVMKFLPDFELYCVGGGSIQRDELSDVPDSVSKRVRHMGFVSENELNILYNRASCLMYPSSYEGFGIPVVEAMRAGCPVVSMSCKAVLEIGREALTVVSEPDPQSMASAVLRTVSTERTILIKTGISVAKNYSWHVTHNQTLNIYRQLGA